MNHTIFIIGTRPEITKIAPIANNLNSKILFTGQHFSKNMSNGFFDLIKNREIINLNLKRFKNFDNNIRFIANQLEIKLKKLNANKIIVQGDTNTTLVGAIATKTLNKKLYFIESGMRSFDISQIEEYNRLITSHLADINFCNYIKNKENLLNEGVSKSKILVTGSTVYSAVNLVDSSIESIGEKKYILLTLHRPENVDKKEKLLNLLKTINKLNYRVIFPVHPRTKANLDKYDIQKLENIKFLKPKNYKDFIELIKYSKFIISDSGGVQEEAAIYRKPLLIPRQYTERPEMLNKFNILVKNNKELLMQSKNILNGNSSLEKPLLVTPLLYGKMKPIENIINGINSK